MKRIRSTRHARLTPRVETLVQLAESYARSSSRLEDLHWEKLLDDAIEQLLADNNEEGLNTALDQLHGSNSRAYDALADTVEAHCESRRIDGYDVQLIALPILAWSRFNIPATTIAEPVLESLRTQLYATILAADAKLAIANFLFSPDHLPQGFCPTSELTQELGQAAIKHQTVSIDPATLPESMKFLSDTRYVVAAIAVKHGEPLFRWQENSTRLEAERAWQTNGTAALQPLLTGCATELVLPQAYFAACRDADRASRPFSIQASIEFLKTTLNIGASQLRAVIAPFYEQDIEEYRVGFTRDADEKEVIYGLVWPLLEAEDENTESASQIEALLNQYGVEQVLILEHRFPVEYCDDCGSPLYPSPDGEIVHAELPEGDSEAVPRHLH